MRALLAIAAVSLLLAGCASSSTDSGSDSTSTTATTSTSTTRTTTTGTTSATTTGAPPANRAPTGSVTATVSGLRANFTLAGSDPDGDSLTYSFDADGKAPVEKTGSEPFPMQATFTYSAAGLYNATLSISDGKSTTIVSLPVNATVGGVSVTSQSFSSSFFIDNPACYDQPYDSLPSNDGPGDPAAEYLNYAKVAVDPGTVGQRWKATFVSGAFEDHVLFLDAAETALETFVTGGLDDPDWEVGGVVPAGAAWAVFYGCQNLAGESVEYAAGPNVA